MPAAADPWAAEPTGDWSDPLGGTDLSGAAAFARVERPVWTAEPAPGSSAAGDGTAVFPLGGPDAPAPAVGPATAALPQTPLDEPAAAVISRQVEAAAGICRRRSSSRTAPPRRGWVRCSPRSSRSSPR